MWLTPRSRRGRNCARLALGRLDVLPTLDGVEAGLLALFLLERQGARVLNFAAPLIAHTTSWSRPNGSAWPGSPSPHRRLARRGQPTARASAGPQAPLRQLGPRGLSLWHSRGARAHARTGARAALVSATRRTAARALATARPRPLADRGRRAGHWGGGPGRSAGDVLRDRRSRCLPPGACR
jgi:hypothetical protein